MSTIEKSEYYADTTNSDTRSDLVFEEGELRSKLKGFEIIKLTEHNVAGQTPKGIPHQWHIYSVVAKSLGKRIHGTKQQHPQKKHQ